MTVIAPTPVQRSIVKSRSDSGFAPVLDDYERVRAEFSWKDARDRELDGLPGGAGLNIAHEAFDRHVAGPRATQLALRWLGKDGARRDMTYADLALESNRFANVLAKLGIGRGDRVSTLAGRIPELYVAALGALKSAPSSPLFSAFGPEPVATRLALAARACS